ncbi:MAG TPA: hypothetical protein VFH51_14715 [Myxococcota bacterium]|nr:hypothetical protein [Myxococcota bacterium]
MGRDAVDTWIRKQLRGGKPRRQADLLRALAQHAGAPVEDLSALLDERLRALEIGLVLKRVEQGADNPHWVLE